MEKKWSIEFKTYMNYIINHPNYKNLPISKKADGSYSWIAPAKSDVGNSRLKWAKQKMREYNISEIDKNPYSKLMFEIHPTKSKPCQICGGSMSLHYIYINSNFAKSIFKEFNYQASTIQSIYDICNDLEKLNFSTEKIKIFLIKSFNLNCNIELSINEIIKRCEFQCRNGNCKKLGPGAMSNFPDRFDGFHTYNRCCRSSEDKGRSKENLKTYGKDRRAYEYWSDGNIYAANIFMHSTYFEGISADHIGPISLGFVHDSNYLRPLNFGDNSSKRDKLMFEDIQTIIEIENKSKINAISWFSKEIWEYIKINYIDHKNHIPIYRIMLKQNMTNFMFILWTIINKCKNNGKLFLTKAFLKEKFDYFNYTYTFNSNGNITARKIRHKTESSRNEINRYIRIAFDSVNDYNTKENRNLKNSLDNNDIQALAKICSEINLNLDFNSIKKEIEKLLVDIQLKLIEKNIH